MYAPPVTSLRDYLIMDDKAFHQLLEKLGLSWQGYARVRKGVKKNIHRHMAERGIKTVASYLEKVEENGEFRKEAERRLAVHISRFFRDEDLWKEMGKDVMPALKVACPEGVRAWSAGCAMGQEVYTLRMVWMIEKENMGVPTTLEIWATDLDADILEKAREGIYSAGSLKGVPGKIRNSFFVSLSDERWMVREDMKKGILWERHDFLREPIRDTFDILFLRYSLLTYYRESISASVLARVMENLRDGGFLVIGRRERIPAGFDVLVPFGSSGCFYGKRLQ